jgi:hypothetical protein
MVCQFKSWDLGPKLTAHFRFLLKYVAGSRDTVELLKRGSSGVNETRNTVEGYEEKSPLYGLIQFRRRKIILKYVPDGTSRVLQGICPSLAPNHMEGINSTNKPTSSTWSPISSCPRYLHAA